MGCCLFSSEDLVGQIEMTHILALGLRFVLLLAVQMTSFVFHSGGKKNMFTVCRFFNKVFFSTFRSAPLLFLTQGMLNFKTALNSSGSCLDYITGMLLQKEFFCRSLFITAAWIFLTQWLHLASPPTLLTICPNNRATPDRQITVG